MARSEETPRDLLFGLLALQIGLIDQDQLVSAFSAWTRARGKTLAEILLDRGAIDAESRSILATMAEKQLKLHGGDTEKSLAAVAVGPSTCEKLAELGDTDLTRSVALVSSHTPSPDATATMSVGTATSDGQRFRVLRPHARGGLGAVFVALDGELNREVALKQILDHHADDPLSRTRFLLEAEITGGLEHPGIVPVYGLGHYRDGRPYYAMRFIRGDSLKDAIAAFHGEATLKTDPGKRSLALRRLLRRFVDVCNAIDYAHGRGVLHRDLKPGNVIVGKHGETLVVDWGLAKALGRAEVGSDTGERTLMPSSSSGSADTLPGSAIGTPAYMSPEQGSGDLEKLGPRSDVYSLGATLYCLLTGKAPFEGKELGAVLRDVQRGAFPKPREVDPTIDKALEAVCLKAMALKPDDRHATARALADDVERWTADEPVSAWKEPASVRARRWMRRNRTVVTAAAVALLATLFGTAAVLAVQTKANEALKLANARERQANVELAAAKDREAARFNLAMDAIGVFHSGISEDFLLQQDEFVSIRNRLLKGASDFYRKLEAELGSKSDRRSLRALGLSYLSLGKLTAKVGSPKEAIARLNSSVEVRRKLAKGPDSDAESRAELGRSFIELSLVLNQDRAYAEAMKASRQALEIFEGLAADKVSGGQYRADLAAALESFLAAGQSHDADGGEAVARQSLAIRADLAREAPTDRKAQFALAASLFNIGYVLTERGGASAEGIAAYERAAVLYESLAGEGQEGATERNILASIYNNLSNVYEKAGQSAEVEASRKRMVALRDSVVKVNPAVATFQNNLGHGLTALGMFYASQRRIDEAVSTYARGRDVLERAIQAHPDSWMLKGQLASNFKRTGDLLIRIGKVPEAREMYHRVLAIFDEQVAANPSNLTFQRSLAAQLVGIGWSLAQAGCNDEAIACDLREEAIRRRLVASSSATLTDSDDLANCQTNLADVLRKGGRRAEARAACDRALAHREPLVLAHPENESYRGGLAETYLRLGQVRLDSGDPAGAASDWRRAAALHETLKAPTGEQIFFGACDHACLSGLAGRPGSGVSAELGQPEAEIALSGLRQAVAAGYTNPNAYRTESALDPIRSRPDFQLLTMDLTFPADPFARDHG